MPEAASTLVELTPDLLEHAHRVALKEAKQRSPKFLDPQEVAQEAVLHLMSSPPKFDPTRGASIQTLVYLATQRFVWKCVAKHCKHAERFQQTEGNAEIDDDQPDEAAPRPRSTGTAATPDRDALEPGNSAADRVRQEVRSSRLVSDDFLEFIADEPSRELCRLVVECGGNSSEVGRRLGITEGAVRYRLQKLAPRLVAAGFNPFTIQEET
jgi:RNA polymerase sigma factor (sigma-70 family)